MASIYVQVEHADKFYSRLQKLNKKVEELDKPMTKAGELAMNAVRSYPQYRAWYNGQVSNQPYRPGSKYKRTFELQNAWQGRLAHVRGTIVRYYINLSPGSPAKRYAPYVVGDRQNPVHAFWWIPISGWPRLLKPYIDKIFYAWYRTLK